MKRVLSVFFALSLFLIGCTQNNTTSLSSNGDSTSNNSIKNSNASNDISSMKSSKSSEQPFVIEDFQKPESEFNDAQITVRNNSGTDIDSPYLSFDFLDGNYDILCSEQTSHLGIVANGQAYTESIYFRECTEAQYVRIASYSGDNASSKSIENPQIFSLS